MSIIVKKGTKISVLKHNDEYFYFTTTVFNGQNYVIFDFDIVIVIENESFDGVSSSNTIVCSASKLEISKHKIFKIERKFFGSIENYNEDILTMSVIDKDYISFKKSLEKVKKNVMFLSDENKKILDEIEKQNSKEDKTKDQCIDQDKYLTLIKLNLIKKDKVEKKMFSFRDEHPDFSGIGHSLFKRTRFDLDDEFHGSEMEIDFNRPSRILQRGFFRRKETNEVTPNPFFGNFDRPISIEDLITPPKKVLFKTKTFDVNDDIFTFIEKSKNVISEDVVKYYGRFRGSFHLTFYDISTAGIENIVKIINFKVKNPLYFYVHDENDDNYDRDFEMRNYEKINGIKYHGFFDKITSSYIFNIENVMLKDVFFKKIEKIYPDKTIPIPDSNLFEKRKSFQDRFSVIESIFEGAEDLILLEK